MTLAASGDTPYNIVLLFHLASVILGVGAAFLLPMGASRARKSGDDTALFDAIMASVLAPALLAAGVFGGALVGFSDDVFDFSQTWLAIAGPLWIVATAAAAFIAPPSYLRLPTLASERVPMVNGILHLSLSAMLVVMVWQPGL